MSDHGLTKLQHDQALGYFNTISGESRPDNVDEPAYSLGEKQAIQELEHAAIEEPEDNPPQDFGQFENITTQQREFAFNRPGIDLAEDQQSKIKSAAHLIYSTGIIRRYFQDKAYGFIRPDDNGLDVWVHKKFCAEGYTPVEGDKVVYLTRLGDGGSLIAKEVSLQLVIGQEPTEVPFPRGGSLIYGNPNLDLFEVDTKSSSFNNDRTMYDVIYGKRS